MKKYFKFALMMLAFMVVFVFPSLAQVVEPVVEDGNFFMDFLAANYEVLAVALTWIIVRVVPTKWKDPILMILNWLISLIPDKKAGGGSHTV